MRRLYRAFKALLYRRNREQDLHDELHSHLSLDAQERIQAGESAEEAAYNAQRGFGSLLRYTEDVRESWGAAGIDRFMHDVRYAFRQMKRDPGFVIVAILTLGLGIGANTAIFSIVNAILVKPLPYSNSDRLVRIVENIPAAESFTGEPLRTTGMSPDSFVEWRSRTKTLSGMAMEMQIAMTLVAHESVRLSGQRVSPALFPMLGIQPAIGRAFEAGEEKQASDKVVILSHGTWVNYLGADPEIVGKALTLDDTPYAVVGVMPPDFIYPDPQTKFWIPLTLPLPHVFSLPVIARLRDDVSITAAAEEASTIARDFRGESPGEPQPQGPSRIQLMTVKDELVSPIRLPLLVFVIAVSFVFLIACINVANLFLARSTTRNREMSIRMAIGASRRRVLRQLLTEHLILALLGGAVGVVLAVAGSRLFVAVGQSLGRTDLMQFGLVGNAIPRLNEVVIDTSVLVFTVALTFVTALFFGLIPAIQIRRVTTIPPVGLHTARSSSVRLQFVRSVMVIGQIALTMVLLLGAGLLTKSFVRLAGTGLGYDPSNVLTFKIPQPALNYPQDRRKQRQQNAFAEEVVSRLALLGDIQAAAFTNELPMVQGYFHWLTPGAARTPGTEGRVAIISRDYFRVMGIRVVEGRGFDADDRRNARAVYLVNGTAVQKYFSGVNPIGKTVSGAGFPPGEIVGIVDDIRQSGLDAEPVPQLFMSPEQLDAVYGGGYYFVVRTTKDVGVIVPAIRAIVHGLDPKLVVDNIATMDQIVANSITTPRSYAVLLGTFSAVALILAMVGLYGLLAYFVKQRTQEMGIRLALGAQRRQVLLLILRQGLVLSVAGLTLGIVGGAALTKYLQKMLFGVTTLDPGTFILAPACFLVMALLAAYTPARQATNVDPLTALRHE